MVNKKTVFLRAKTVALIAVLSALLEGGKMALSALPNVEVVTLLCAVYGFVFGLYGCVSVFIFVGMEVLIWGVGTWVLSYCIYFPLVCLVFMLFDKKNIKSRMVFVLTAICLTTLFGVLTSLVDVGLFSSEKINFWTRFSIMYVRGIWFYVTEIVCNCILFATAFPFLTKLCKKLKIRYFS